jgi:phage terminase small subunit
MPRKSAAAFELGKLNVQGRPSHIGIPSNLPKSLKEIVTDIISSHAPEHFRQTDDYLLEMYAQAIVGGREAFDHLETEGFVVNKKANPWLIVQEKCHRAEVALAGRLRLAPQQRMDCEKAARERPSSVGVSYRSIPWEKD